VRQTLLCSTILCAAGAMSASAAEPIKLSVGGFFREAYLVVADDDGPQELGFDRNTDGFFNDAEIHFVGRTTLDNGLEVGARVELEGETDGDQIDEAWVWFSGGFGEFRIGSDDDALANACIMPPGGTTNFSAFSPNQWGANSQGDAAACEGSSGLFVGSSDAQKILYITPNFAGFQLTVSYTPDQTAETHFDGAGPHLGMTPKGAGDADYATSAYLTYQYEGADWGLTWGGGVSMQSEFGLLREGDSETKVYAQDFYQTGLNLSFGNFSVGGAFEYYNDAGHFHSDNAGDDFIFDFRGWSAGGGVAYTLDAWTFGAQYARFHGEFDTVNEDDGIDIHEERDLNRVVATVNYALGPGISVDGELGYTWIDADNEEGGQFAFQDGYDAFEIGIGTAINF
jgi:hypothetical protein